MKRILLCYNPVSGKGNFKYELDYVVHKLQEKNFNVALYRLSRKESVSDFFGKIINFNYDSVVAAGGDGTINAVVNALIHNDINVPLGIIPVGTSNDFASNINLDKGLDFALETIIAGKYRLVDIGSINGRSFVNVVSIGKLASIAHKTNHTIKNNLGKLGYYVNVLHQSPVLENFKVKILTENNMYEEEAVLVLVLNSRGAGGFKNLAPNAKIDDGKFDLLLIKNCNLVNKLALFAKIIRGDHHNDDCILCFQADKIYMDCEDFVETDVDGEVGPKLPMVISFDKKIKVLS